MKFKRFSFFFSLIFIGMSSIVDADSRTENVSEIKVCSIYGKFIVDVKDGTLEKSEYPFQFLGGKVCVYTLRFVCEKDAFVGDCNVYFTMNGQRHKMKSYTVTKLDKEYVLTAWYESSIKAKL